MFNALKAENSPFNDEQIALLQQSLSGLDASQSAWLSGFIAGRLAALDDATGDQPAIQAQVAAQAQPAETLHVYFASQTGNGETIAMELAEQARQSGLVAELHSLGTQRPASLRKVKYAVFVISTHGEGDPPDDALDWFEYLEGPRAPQLESLQFAVLALGDRSYSQFCAAGQNFEALLIKQGARVFADRTDCDLDYAAAASQWSEQVIKYGAEVLLPESDESASSPATTGAARLSVVPPTARWSRANPFQATVERVQKITGLESDKDVYHVELSLEDAGIDYEPGDALAVCAPNDHQLVDSIIRGFGFNSVESVTLNEHSHTLHEALLRHKELTRLTPDTVRGYARLVKNEELLQVFESADEAWQRKFIEQRQFIDLLESYPPQSGNDCTPQMVIDLLRPLAPRSYSIASSRSAVDEEVHLTVATLFSQAEDEQRRGVASYHLNHQLEPGDQLGVFLEPNKRFRLPADRTRPLILISAGTGVAPYRGFLQQLENEHARPDTWLIFGNPHFRTDFLYQREWLDWRSKGLLTRIDIAFSRDQQEKRYVQHVIAEQQLELYRWLENEAVIYICGSLAMGHQVEDALVELIATQRQVDVDAAREALSQLRRDGRLLKDLY